MRYITVIFLTILITSQSFPQKFLTGIPYNHNTHWLFTDADTSYGNWKYLDTLPQSAYGITTYYWADSNKIFLCGGVKSSGVDTNCYFYNITLNTYERKASLPTGRALGKLVRVKDSLYLIGSIGSSFSLPDGKIYRYYPAGNSWQEKAVMPFPYLHECAVVVWNDSLILTIGGSQSGFNTPTSFVRVYDPYLNSWRTLNINYIRNTTAAHAECIDSTIVVLGGYGTGYNQSLDKGKIINDSLESLTWWQSDSINPFGTGIYRVGGGRWNNYALFGPAMRNNISYGKIWGYSVTDSTWRSFLPNTLDTAGNRPTIAVKSTNDSLYFYLFGGILNTTLAITSHSERYACGNPIIGITKNSNSIPEKFVLYQNYPNPFNAHTKIKFDIPTASSLLEGEKELRMNVVTIKIYDILGREAITLINENLRPGIYEINFDASKLSTGIYFYTLSYDDNYLTKRMVLVK
jgi:hypothetical protein